MKFLSGLIMILLLWSGNLFSQVAVTSAGGNANGAGGSASYSVGQVAYSSANGTNGKINQGVQQPYEFFITGWSNNRNIRLEMSVFPNPVRSIVSLKIDQPEKIDGLVYLLYDIKGTLILKQNIVAALTEIPMSELAAANYLLRVTNSNNEEIQTFKIIKN